MGLRRTLTMMSLGAGLMYFYDPEEGRRRRSLLRDQWQHLQNETRDFSSKAQRDLQNRRQGLRSEPGSLFKLPGGLDGLSGAWTPGVRLVSTLAGGGITFYGLVRGGLKGTAATLIGLNLVSRGVANTGLRGFLGTGSAADTIDFDKTLTVNAPVEETFKFWRNYANFPRFMSHVLEVRDLGDGRSHWVVEGPAGTAPEWDATITEMQLDRLLAWESIPGSPVHTTGRVRFDGQDACTRIRVHLSYRPPAGAVGHAVASLFGVDPKTAMDDDMMRFKSLVESGRTTKDGQEITKDEVMAQRAEADSPAPSPGQTANNRQNRSGRQGQSQSDMSQASGSQQGVAAEQASISPSRPKRSKPGSGRSGRVDQVGQTGVYPASDPDAPPDAEARGMASWGQGERGAAGYEDSGGSELNLGDDPNAGFSSIVPGNPDEPKSGD